MQDPLHYGHGTKWMAPGPLGQVHPLPADVNVRAEMARVAHNHAAVYKAYNFDWDPEPGSVDAVINARIRRGAELQGRRLLRMAGGLDAAEAAEGGGGGGGANPVAALAELLAPAWHNSNSNSGGGGGGGSDLPAPQQQHPQQQQQQQAAAAPSSSSGGLPFASMTAAAGPGALWLTGGPSQLSQSVGGASRAVLRTMARAARRAPCSLQVQQRLRSGRPTLSRPAARTAAPTVPGMARQCSVNSSSGSGGGPATVL